MSKIIDSIPKQDGYFMPAEYEPHAGCWIIWPERTDNWRLGAKPAQATFVEVATAISQFESVTVAVSDRQFGNARSLLPPEIRLVELSTNDSWARDCGPTFVKKGNNLRAVDWQFNAWGGLDSGLYFPWDLDAKVAQKIAEIERIDLYKAPFVLEGGSIHVDGEGTLLTTEECLLNPNRNPNLSKSEIETLLKAYLNVSKIIWLKNGVYNDETNGHVDNICCFIRPGVVALTWTDDKNDPQYAHSINAYERLSAATDAQGRAFEIHKIHQPGPIYITKEESEGVDSIEGTLPRQEGDRLAGSYINFYIANHGIVLPIFNDPHDQQAIDQIRSLFPDRKVIPIFAREILLGGGNIHCITQQQPASSL